MHDASDVSCCSKACMSPAFGLCLHYPALQPLSSSHTAQPSEKLRQGDSRKTLGKTPLCLQYPRPLERVLHHHPGSAVIGEALLADSTQRNDITRKKSVRQMPGARFASLLKLDINVRPRQKQLRHTYHSHSNCHRTRSKRTLSLDFPQGCRAQS